MLSPVKKCSHHERNRVDFFTGGSIIMNCGLVFWPEAMV